MSPQKHIVGLVQLTDLQFRAIQSEMAKLLQQEVRLRQNLAQLTQSRRARALQPPQPDDVAMIAGADLRWHQWVDQRRAVINGELAQVLSAKERCRVRLQRAFGRDQAAQMLAQRAEKERLQIRKRRDDYES